jgi:hypothetical protein
MIELVRNMQKQKLVADEAKVRYLLEHWVSELEPAIAMRDFEIIGLCDAAAEPGTYPAIFTFEDARLNEKANK